MWVFYILLFVIVGALYLAYLGLVTVPACAAIAFAIYTVGMPAVYVMGLAKVCYPAPRIACAEALA